MSEKEVEFSRLISVKECPKCGGTLDKGYFTAIWGMFWDTEKHGLAASLSNLRLRANRKNAKKLS